MHSNKTKAQLLAENKKLNADIEKLHNTIGEQNDKLHENAHDISVLKERLKNKEARPTAISKVLYVEKLKDQKFTMKVNRGEIKEPCIAKIAGELCGIADVVNEMTVATESLLENHIAGTAVAIEVSVTVLP